MQNLSNFQKITSKVLAFACFIIILNLGLFRIEPDRNLFTKSGKKKLGEIGIASAGHYLAVLETVEGRIEKLEGEFEEIVEDYEKAQLLMTIPELAPFPLY